MIQPGQKINLEFTVKAVGPLGAGGVREVFFRDLLKRRTIVSAHMKNNTPSCDRQVADLSAYAEEFAALGYDIVMLSRDTASAHLKYSLANKIPFALVGDNKDAWAQAAGSMVEKQMYGRTFLGPARTAWVIEADGTVVALVEKVDTSAHAEQVRVMIAGLKQ